MIILTAIRLEFDAVLQVAREAVDLYRQLATRYPDAFHPDLSRSLSNLGDRLSELGQRNEAFAAMREAVDLYRTLAMKHPDVFQSDLATTLKKLSAMSESPIS